MDERDLVPVEIAGFSPAKQPGGFAIFLREKGTQRCVPIVVGAAEAQAISLILSPLQLERPMTHDTIKNIIDALHGSIERIVVTHIEENTFYADILLHNTQGDIFHLDARPSDAIALALRNNADICVARSVLDEAGIDIPQEVLDGNGEKEEENTEINRLKRALNKAVEEENYEEAARLRDELRNAENNAEHNTHQEDENNNDDINNVPF